MSFERKIEVANEKYIRQGVADVEKIATPWKVKRDNRGNVKKAWPEKKSTVDFVGIANNGKYIVFEAKETENKTRFPLSMIERHQYNVLKRRYEMGGFAFVLIHFKEHKEIYRLPFVHLRYWVEEQTERKSIPYEWFKNNQNILGVSLDNGVLDYLPVVMKG